MAALRTALAALLLGFVITAQAAASMNELQQSRYQALIAELRCLVCQNQNIADSNAPLAVDLRAQVEEMILAGQTDAEIKDYLVERYGDFVLYRPPLKPQTWLLWGGPFLLLLLGLLIARQVYKGRGDQLAESAPDPDALRRALNEDARADTAASKDKTP